MSPENLQSSPEPDPAVVAVEMGYGHLRAARSIADALGTSVVRADREPWCGPAEARTWERTRRLYDAISRGTEVPLAGRGFRRLLDSITFIDHLHPRRDQSAPSWSAKKLAGMVGKGFGSEMAARLRDSGRGLITTYFAAAVAAEQGGVEEIWCVVTDTDVQRVWAPADARGTRIRYLVPTQRALRRLRAYGVPRENIEHTGFPLPLELTGDESLGLLRRRLAARLARLDPEGVFRDRCRGELAQELDPAETFEDGQPPLITFAVGGAGAQMKVARQGLESLAGPVRDGRLRLALVAGVRPEVRDRFHRWLGRHGLAECDRVRVLWREGFDEYYRAFNDLLAETDLLWTKPSEIVFYGALGIPLLLSWPVGYQERYNRRFIQERGAGVPLGDPRRAGPHIEEWLSEGVLAAAAWSGFRHLPAHGTHRIAALLLPRDSQQGAEHPHDVVP